MRASTFDDNGALAKQQDVFTNGTTAIKYLDTRNTHPYTEVDIDEDATGKPTAVQVKLDGQPNTTADFSAVGQVLGSALGRALAPNNQFVQLAAGTVIGAVGQRLAQAFVASLAIDGTKFDPGSVFANFGLSLASAGASSIASFFVAELGTALHLDGFSGQLFNAAGGGFAGSVASQIATKMAATPGLTFDAAIAGLDFGSAAVNAAYGVSALLGSFLGHQLAPAQTHEGAVGGQLLGAVGSAIGISAALTGALGTVLGFLAPGIGSLFGTILGTLIGDAFSSVPHPAATDLLDRTDYLYGYTHYQTSASDGGSYSTPDQMVVPALAIINAYLNAVKGAALDHSKQVTLGYQTDPASYINGVPGHPTMGVAFNANAAVEAAALDVLQNTEVIGGDLFMKRAHQNSSSSHSPAPLAVDPGSNGDPGATGSAVQVSAAEQLAVMSGDLALAQDYENYLNNREAINALMAANPDSAFTAGWIATFARVQELGLNHVNASDFTGGLVGYLDSVNKAGLSSAASSVSVSQGAADNSVITVAIKLPNGVEVPGSLAAFADVTNVSGDASGQTVQLIFGASLAAAGFHRPDAGITSGDGANDLWFGDGSGQTFNGTSGHDILVGGSGNDTIHGGPGWDFVQGGAGNDTLSGDDGNDILRGDAGNDVLNGGAGFDTAVFGGKVGSYTTVAYNGTIGVLTHGTDGSDRLQAIESLQFTDTAIAPGAVAAFDALAYIASYPDLIVAFGLNPQSGFDQYVGSGFAEGRSISFDAFEYIASNPDLIAAFGLNAVAAEQHYIASGFSEHRPTAAFDAAQYLANYPDLAAAFGNDFVAAEQHYIVSGFHEGRTDKAPVNHAPVLTMPADVINGYAGHALQVSSWFSATDADHDAPTYIFADGTTAANSGQFVLNGTPQGQGAVVSVSAAQLAGLTFVAGAADSTDYLSMQLSDGHAVSQDIAFSVHVNHEGPFGFDPATSPLATFAIGAGGWSSENQYPRLVADVNGDHMADIVGFGADGVSVALATGNGQFAAPVGGITNFGYLGSAGGWVSEDQYPRQLADVNGDHMADIVAFGADGVIVALATGNGHFGSPVVGIANNFAFLGSGGGWASQDQYPRQLADVNGDGMADIVGFGANGVIVALATGDGHFGAPVVGIADNFGYLGSAGGWSSENQYPRLVADVNGDGMADIVGFGANGVSVALATGGGHFASPVGGIQNFGYLGSGGGWSSENQYPRLLADVNGDHMADIIGFGADLAVVSLATGNGQFAAPVAGMHGLTPNAGGWASQDLYPRELGDVNGDGMADVIGFAHDGVFAALSNGFHLV